MTKFVKFYDEDWWYKNDKKNIWFKFQHNDYLEKIENLNFELDKFKNENKRLRTIIDKLKQRNIINEYL